MEQNQSEQIKSEQNKYLQFGKYTSDCPDWLLEKAKKVDNGKIDDVYVKKILMLINDEFNPEKHQITKTTDFRKSRFISADEVISKRQRSCGSVATVVAAVFRNLGIPTKLIHGYLGAGENMRHAWNEIYFAGAWHPYDITTDNFGVSKKYHIRKQEYVDWEEMEKENK